MGLSGFLVDVTKNIFGRRDAGQNQKHEAKTDLLE